MKGRLSDIGLHAGLFVRSTRSDVPSPGLPATLMCIAVTNMDTSAEFDSLQHVSDLLSVPCTIRNSFGCMKYEADELWVSDLREPILLSYIFSDLCRKIGLLFYIRYARLGSFIQAIRMISLKAAFASVASAFACAQGLIDPIKNHACFRLLPATWILRIYCTRLGWPKSTNRTLHTQVVHVARYTAERSSFHVLVIY